MNVKFSTILCDMPWSFSDTLQMSDVPRGAEANYKLLSNQDILNLDIPSLVDPEGCVLALWVPSSLLQEGLDTMKKFGFEQKQSYIWVKSKLQPLDDMGQDLTRSIRSFMKENKLETLSFPKMKELFEKAKDSFSLNNTLGFFMGRLMRQCHEVCLLGINDSAIYKKLQNKSQRSVCLAPNLKHSAKPENLHESLELMFPTAKRVELFARRQRKGWLCVGNEAPMTYGENIDISLKKLNNLSESEYNDLISFEHDYQKMAELWSKINLI